MPTDPASGLLSLLAAAIAVAGAVLQVSYRARLEREAKEREQLLARVAALEVRAAAQDTTNVRQDTSLGHLASTLDQIHSDVRDVRALLIGRLRTGE